jgi:excisionase family DNA binding protein
MKEVVTRVISTPPAKEPCHTIDEFLNLIADAIADRLERRESVKRRVLDLDQVAEYLGASEDTIHRMVAEGRLVPVRFDRRLRFDVRDLDRLIEEAKGKV